MSRPRRAILVGALLAATVGCDQATKRIATATLSSSPTRSFLGDTFRLTYAENKGAFLSLGAGLGDGARFWILTVVVGALLLGILGFALFGKKMGAWQVAGYALIGGGGLSNWVDRTTRDGSVVDFMNMGIGSLRTGIFNVADLAIMAGIAIVLLASRKKTEVTTPAH